MTVVDSINCACSDTTGNRTLGELRTSIARLLGYGVVAANLPPGTEAELNEFVQGAQRRAYKRLQLANLRTERWYSWPLTAGVALYDLPANAERDQLVTPVNAAFSTLTTGGSLIAGTYWYRVSAINANGETLASTETSQVVPAGTSTNTVTVNWGAVTGATGYKIYGRTTGAQLLLATVGAVTTYTDTGALTPAGALPTENTTWICGKQLDPLAITWVGYELDGVFTPLTRGIRPSSYGSVTGLPQRYEIRQCIELWPPPASTAGNLVIRGHFGLEAFEDDDDQTTIDDELVFLLALGNAKAHKRHPDAQNYIAQFEVYLASIIAGGHAGRRYIPGAREGSNYVQPVPTEPFDP